MPRRRLAKIAGTRNAAGVRILAHGERLSLIPAAAAAADFPGIKDAVEP
jgi:hypothetical protein